jgi:hypothetical protein
MTNGKIVVYLWRSGKRTVAIALLGLTVGILAAPATSLAASHAAPSVGNPAGPSDGVGDSPIMP